MWEELKSSWYWLTSDFTGEYRRHDEPIGPEPFTEWVDQPSFYNPVPGTNSDIIIMSALGYYIYKRF